MTTHIDPYKQNIIPYLTVKNGQESLDFYSRAFRFEKEDVLSENDIISHAEMSYRGVLVMFGCEGAYKNDNQAPVTSGLKCPMGLYIYTDDVDEFFKHAVANGAQALAAPEDQFWGDRMCRLEDVNGYVWSFGQRILK